MTAWGSGGLKPRHPHVGGRYFILFTRLRERRWVVKFVYFLRQVLLRRLPGWQEVRRRIAETPIRAVSLCPWRRSRSCVSLLDVFMGRNGSHFVFFFQGEQEPDWRMPAAVLEASLDGSAVFILKNMP